MKNREIYELRKSLEDLSNIKGKTFAYTVFKNKEILDKEIEIINQLKKEPHPDYMNYENERQLLCIKHAEKDDNNNPVLVYNPDGSQVFKIKDLKTFNEEYAEVAEKYKETIDDMNLTKKEFEDFLEKDSDVELKKVSIDELPEDIDAAFISKIKHMIE